MELFGEKLREARESKKYTIDQVARDTHISRQYIIALENDDFQSFPGETYLIGFLRSYTEYLDLDPEHFINLYKNLKIQEEPLPFNELLEKRKKIPGWIIIVSAVSGIALIATAAVFFIITVLGKPGTAQEKQKDSDNTGREYAGTRYTFSDEVMTEWFRKGDVVMIPVAENEYALEFFEADDYALIRIGEESITLSLLNEKSFDLNADDRFDLSIVMNDFRESDIGKEVNIGLYKITVLKPVYTEEEIKEKEAGMSTSEPGSVSESTAESSSPPNATGNAFTPVPTILPTPTIASETTTDKTAGMKKMKEDTRVKIIDADKSGPFNIKIVFRGNCLFKYQIDGKNQEEKYFTTGDAFDFAASTEVIMWISNANSVKAAIENVPVNMGKPGQVVVKFVYWVKDSSTGKYSLDIVSLQ